MHHRQLATSLLPCFPWELCFRMDDKERRSDKALYFCDTLASNRTMHWQPPDEEHFQLLYCQLHFHGKYCTGKRFASRILCWLLIASVIAFRDSTCTWQMSRKDISLLLVWQLAVPQRRMHGHNPFKWPFRLLVSIAIFPLDQRLHWQTFSYEPCRLRLLNSKSRWSRLHWRASREAWLQ